MKIAISALTLLAFAGWAGFASSQAPITDTVTVDGKKWAQVDLFLGLSWNDMNAACPSGVCSGSLNGWDMNGWTWAETEDMNALFNHYIGSSELGADPDSYSVDNISIALSWATVDGWRSTQNTLPTETWGRTSDQPALFAAATFDVFSSPPLITFSTRESTDLVNQGIVSGWGGWFYKDVPPSPIEGDNIVTVNGRDWAQVDLFNSLSWNDINAVCPGGICAPGGTLNHYDMTNMIWADTDEVNALFNYYIGSLELGPGPGGYGGAGYLFGDSFFNVDGWRPTTTLNGPEIFGDIAEGLISDSGDRLAVVQFGIQGGVVGSYMSTNEQSPFLGPIQDQPYFAAWFYRITDVPTPAGINVQVDFVQGTTVTFDNVTTEGTTTVDRYEEPPAGTPTATAFQLNGKYFDVSTTALFSGEVELCFTYSDDGLSLAEEGNLRLLHFNEATMLWEDDTLAPNDTDNNKICGTTTHFSVFAVGLPYDTDNDVICDKDAEVVGICDAGPDNCPVTPNSDQADGDLDGDGDVCDNCPLIYNAAQRDHDNDGIGNFCDEDFIPGGC